MKQRLTFLSIAQRPTLMSAPFGAIPRCQDPGLGFYPGWGFPPKRNSIQEAPSKCGASADAVPRRRAVWDWRR